MDIVKLERELKESNRDYVYRCLRESIVRTAIAPGTVISEPILQQYFEMSRSPIREAISILSHEGLLEVMPQKGTRIVLIDKKYVLESRFLRYIIERDILLDICRKMDTALLSDRLDSILLEAEEISECSTPNAVYKLNFTYDSMFHSTIFEYYGFKHMWKILRLDNIQYDRFLSLYLKNRLNGEKFIQQHRDISMMIRNKDVEGIKRQAWSNYIGVEEYIKDMEREHPDYFMK